MPDFATMPLAAFVRVRASNACACAISYAVGMVIQLALYILDYIVPIDTTMRCGLPLNSIAASFS